MAAHVAGLLEQHFRGLKFPAFQCFLRSVQNELCLFAFRCIFITRDFVARALDARFEFAVSRCLPEGFLPVRQGSVIISGVKRALSNLTQRIRLESGSL